MIFSEVLSTYLWRYLTIACLNVPNLEKSDDIYSGYLLDIILDIN
jgi:hypothetical protein